MPQITENDLAQLGFERRQFEGGRVTWFKGDFLFYFNGQGLPRLEKWMGRHRVVRNEELTSGAELADLTGQVNA